MKKVLLIVSLFNFTFLLSNNINATETKLLEESDKIEFNKCYNYQITSDNISCSNEKIFLTLKSLDEKYFCSQIPFIKEEKLRGNRFTSLPIDLALSRPYVCDVWFERFWGAGDCTNKYGAKRRQKCFDAGNFVLFKPSKPLSYKYCVNNFKKLRTTIVSIDNKQNCSLLTKYDSSWEEGYELTYELTHEYISYWEYVKNTNLHGNIIIVEEKQNNNSKEEERKRKAKEADEKRIAEEKKKAKEAEDRRIAEEKRKAKEEEEKRIAEAKKAQEEELYVIGSGTGFFVNKDGYIVTNEHVAGICQSLASYINGETHLFKIIALDKRNDLALLRGEYRNKTYLNINILGAEFGEDIMAFGFPLAENLSSSVKLTRGIVSSLSGPENDISLIQIDAAIQPGNSGGPVLNYNGQVVGVASSGLNKIQMLLDEESPYIPENVNFAVSANTLTGFLRSNSITIFNETYEKQSSQDLAKIGMPPTIQLHCLNTMTAHKKLRESENYNDVLLKKVVNLK